MASSPFSFSLPASSSSPPAPSSGSALTPLPNESLPDFVSRGANLSSVQSFVSSQPAGFNIDTTDSKGDTAVIIAARLGNLELLEYLASKGGDLHHLNLKRSNALIAAAMKGFPKIVKYLIQTGADVNLATDSNDTALSLAIWQNHTECCIELIEAGADIDHIDKFGDIMLIDAAKHGAVTVMRKLLSKMSLSVNHQNKKGESALHRAAAKGDVESVHLLLEHKANPTLLNKAGMSPLSLACVNEKYDCASVLIPVSKDVFEKGDEPGGTPLKSLLLVGVPKNVGWEQINLLIQSGAKLDGVEELSSLSVGGILLLAAAKNSQLSTLRLLISSGKVDVNFKNAAKRNALHSHFSEGCNQEVVQTLIDAGIDVNYQDAEGNSPLMLAVKANSLPVVTALLKAGADITLVDKYGQTALDLCKKKVDNTLTDMFQQYISKELGQATLLQLASKNGDLIKIKEIVEGSGAVDDKEKDIKPSAPIDVNTVDSNGRTALMVAARFNQVDAIKMLLNYGATVDIADRDGNTALSIAIEGGNKDATLLLSHAQRIQMSAHSGKGSREELAATTRFILRAAHNIQNCIDVAKENQELKKRIAELTQQKKI